MVGQWIIFTTKMGRSHTLRELRTGTANTIAYSGSNLIMQKVKEYALALAAMVAGVTMGYVIFGLIIYIVWRI
jgi:hypothetical protein